MSERQRALTNAQVHELRVKYAQWKAMQAAIRADLTPYDEWIQIMGVEYSVSPTTIEYAAKGRGGYRSPAEKREAKKGKQRPIYVLDTRHKEVS